MNTKISTLVKNIEASIYNPNAVQDVVLDTLYDMQTGEGVEVLDVNNPVAFCIEAAAAMSQASIETQAAHTRRRNAIMAQNVNELYGHLADADSIDIFAQPSNSSIKLMLGKNEVINKVHPQNQPGVRKLIIPKDTEFRIQGYVFSIQYDIEIKVMPHGGIQVAYNVNDGSPIRGLTSNTLEWDLISIPIDGVPLEMISIDIPVLQYQVVSFTGTITSGLSYREEFTFDNKYYFIRVWNKKNGKWTELKTTHDVEIINVDHPTAQIKVLEDKVEVHIPDIYIKTGLVSTELRIDIYSTLGELELNLSSYTSDKFSITYRDLSKSIDIAYYSPLNTFSHISVLSTDVTRGGRDRLSFNELKERVVDNSFGGRKSPISEKQLTSEVNNLGMDIYKSIDYVTERIYLATADMPPSTISNLSTAIGTINGYVETDIDELINLSTVKNNGARITIEPGTLYQLTPDGIVPDTVGIENYRNLTPTDLVNVVNTNSFLFTPFHYVLDTNNQLIESRPYYLDNPKIDSKSYIENNGTLDLEVSTAAQTIRRTETGYELMVVTRSNAAFKTIDPDNIRTQVQFVPRGYDDEYAYLDGVLEGLNDAGDYVFKFNILSNLDIDRNHDIIVNSFIQSGDVPTPIALQLISDMNIVYAVANYSIQDYHAIKADRIYTASNGEAKVITHERLTINLGSYLGTLWSNVRTVPSSIQYRRYEEDVYATYTDDVKKRDENGRLIYEIVEDNGRKSVIYDVLHEAGDFILDDEGNKTIKHHKGHIVHGPDGQPIIENGRKIKRRLEMFMMDARYIFSDHPETLSYMRNVTKLLLGYISVDLPILNKSTLEKTDIFFYPKTNMGEIDVLLGDGTSDRLTAETKFNFHYYLNGTNRGNEEFIDTLARITREVVINNLSSKTVSLSSITADIRERMGNEIVSVEVDGIGNDGKQKIFTIKGDTDVPILGKKLVVNPDSTISIEDNISISYNRHELNT